MTVYILETTEALCLFVTGAWPYNQQYGNNIKYHIWMAVKDFGSHGAIDLQQHL